MFPAYQHFYNMHVNVYVIIWGKKSLKLGINTGRFDLEQRL